MTVASQMRRHGFVPWRAMHGVEGFEKVFRHGPVGSLVVMPVHSKSIRHGNDAVLACQFDRSHKMCADRFYDSLYHFLESHSMDTSLLSASSWHGESGSLGAGIVGFFLLCTEFLRKRLLPAR